MNYRVAFFVCLTLLLGSLLLNLPGRMQAQEAEAPKPVIGRYQMESVALPAGTAQVTVCDTTTGECWVRTGNARWFAMGLPMAK